MELTAYLTLYCANSVLMRPDLSADGHLIGGKGLKCIVNGVREAPLTAALMTRKVCKCISNLSRRPITSHSEVRRPPLALIKPERIIGGGRARSIRQIRRG